MLELREKRIIVTGGHGFLGTHVLEALRERGVAERHITAPTAEECDLREKECCMCLMKGADIVLHLAGVTGDSEFHAKEPGRIYFDNVVMTAEIVEAARRAGAKRCIVIGSATEYPANAPLPFEEDSLWNGFPEIKHAPYAIAKRLMTVQAWSYGLQYQFPVAHLVMTNMYGPGESLASNVFIPSLVKRMLEAKEKNISVVEMGGNGEATRDFLYVKDAAEAILRAAERVESPVSINIASGEELSVRSMAETVKSIIEYKGMIRFPANAGGVPRRSLTTRKAEELLEFKAKTKFAEGVRAVIEDFSKRLKVERKKAK